MITDSCIIFSGLIDPRDMLFINPSKYQGPPYFFQEKSVNMTVIFKHSFQMSVAFLRLVGDFNAGGDGFTPPLLLVHSLSRFCLLHSLPLIKSEGSKEVSSELEAVSGKYFSSDSEAVSGKDARLFYYHPV